MRAGLLAAFLLAAWPTVSDAADPPPAGDAAAVADSAAAPPAEVPFSEVPRLLDEGRRFIRQLEAELVATEADSAIAAEVEETRADLDELLDTPIARHPERASGRAVRDLEASGQRRLEKLGGWARKLEEDAAELDERRREVQASRATWVRTGARASEDELAAGLVAGIDSLIAAHDAAGAELDRRYAEVLDQRTSISAQTDRLDALLGSLAEARTPILLDLLRPDSPPLWRALSEPAEKAGQVRSTWEEAIAPVPGFFVDNLPSLIVHILLVGLLLALLMVARGRRQRWEAEGDAASGAPSILDRPVAAAVLGGLMLLRPLYPPTPSIILTLVRLASAPALLFLVPQIVPRRYVQVSWTIAALFLIDTLEFLFLEDPELRRVHLLLVTALGLVAALVSIRGLLPGESEKEQKVRRGIGWAAVALLGLAFVANGYGAVEFAAICSDAVLQILYLGIFSIVAARVLEAIAGILLRVAPLRHLRSVRVHRALLERRTQTIVHLLVALFFARSLLEFLGLTRAFWSMISALMNLGGTVGSVTITLGDFVAFFATLWISLQVSRLLQFFLGEDVLPRISLPRGVSQTILRLLHYALMTLGFMAAVATTGFDVGKLTILAGGLGVGVGFGLQTIVNNFISGLILMFERPVQVGDTIEVGTLIGRVQKIGIRASTIRTYSGAEVVVPNANLIANEVVNWTLSDRRRRVEIPIGVAYGSDPEQVRQILLAAAAGNESALDQPEPLAFFLGFGDSALDFELRFWTREFEEWQRVRGEVAATIQASLAEAGIEIPFPQRTIHMAPKDAVPAPRSTPPTPPAAPE